LTPQICEEIKRRINEEFEKHIPHQTPDETKIGIYKVLCGFAHSTDPNIKPIGTHYKYFKIKTKDDINGHHIISVHPATEGEYLAFELEETETITTLTPWHPTKDKWYQKKLAWKNKLLIH